MKYPYAIIENGKILETYSTPDEAYEAAVYAYRETGIFHAVVELDISE